MQPLPDLARLLARVEHFRHFSEKDRAEIIGAGQTRIFPTGATIFREGEECAGMFVLLAGHVHLYKLGPQGRQSLLAEVEPVIMFNEVTVLDGGVNLTTALAVRESTVWNISCVNFQALLQKYPLVGVGLLQVLAQRTRALLSQYEDLSFRSVLARTAKLLLTLSHHGKRPIDRKAYTNADMAARLSTAPEAFSRSLQLFRKNGDIVCTRTTITVRQPQMLEKFAHVERTLLKG